MSLFRKKERKKKRGKLLLTGLVLFLLFFFFVPWEDWGEDDYDDDYVYEAEETSHTVSSSHSSGNHSFADVQLTGAVREPQVVLDKGNDTEVTILVYMNGSNLESESGAATSDLKEMVRAGSSDNVKVVVQTMGTKKWKRTFGIASDRSQIYEVNGDGLKLVKDDLGQLDCTKAKTLSDFISWGTEKYPADRYMLILWDHGGGPVYGFGYDEFRDENEALTIDEIQSALRSSGTYFDVIGFDACIMSSLELGCALYEHCDYMIVSEDFEPGIGWYYTEWLRQLQSTPAMPTPQLAKIVCDTTVEVSANGKDPEDFILSLIDVGKMKLLYKAWIDFAYTNEDALLNKNYSRKVVTRGRTHPSLARAEGTGRGIIEFLFGDDTTTMDDYYITDIMELAMSIDSDESDVLAAALSQTVQYTKASDGINGLTGISITLPYGDYGFFDELETVFTGCGFSEDYIEWLYQFVDAEGSEDFFDTDDWDDFWSGWDDYEDDYDWDDWDALDEDEDYWEDDDEWGWIDFLLYVLE